MGNKTFPLTLHLLLTLVWVFVALYIISVRARRNHDG